MYRKTKRSAGAAGRIKAKLLLETEGKETGALHCVLAQESSPVRREAGLPEQLAMRHDPAAQQQASGCCTRCKAVGGEA